MNNGSNALPPVAMGTQQLQPHLQPNHNSNLARMGNVNAGLLVSRPPPVNNHHTSYADSPALSIIANAAAAQSRPALPAGFSSGEDDSRGPGDQFCCLMDDGEICRNIAGNASYSKRIQKTVAQRRLKLTIAPNAPHIYICDFHKARIQCARTKRRRKDSEDDSPETDTEVPEVALNQLQVSTLRRYKRFHKVVTRPGINKAQLAESIAKHFKQIPVKEKECLTYFIYMVKTSSNKLDQKNGTAGLLAEPNT